MTIRRVQVARVNGPRPLRHADLPQLPLFPAFKPPEGTLVPFQTQPKPVVAGRCAGDAVMSPCERWRYVLRRWWEQGAGCVCWIMLNPSTADATCNDPTVTRVIRFSQDWGYRQLTVINLYAYRATDPNVLRRKLAEGVDAVGLNNDAHIRWELKASDLIVCAWGVGALSRARDVMSMIVAAGKVPHCLKLTKANHPGHPLYLSLDTKPFPYKVPVRK